MLTTLYEERDSGNVDYLAPYVDVFNEVFRGQIRLIQSKKPCGGKTIGLMQYMDRTIQNTEVFDIVFNGICSIEVPANNTLVEITQTDLPVDFLKISDTSRVTLR